MTTYMFPGQGSQYIGMGGNLFDEFADISSNASEILGYSIKELCLSDTRNLLSQTQYTQPAIYVVNALSYLKRESECACRPDYLVGHSLGEFNALLAAKCFNFETGLRIVKKRGELMGRAVGGGMAALVGTGEEEVQWILNKNGCDDIDIANHNTPSQVVVSGPAESVEKIRFIFKECGVQYIKLNTSGAFHSRYMSPFQAELDKYVRQLHLDLPTVPVVSNVSARPYGDDELVSLIVAQLSSPVRWCESIAFLLEADETEFLEIGNTNVLTKLVDSVLSESSLFKKSQPSRVSRPKVQPELAASAQDLALNWNMYCPIGTKVKISSDEGTELKTRSEAKVLFGRRPVVYLEGFNGFFDLDVLVAPTIN